MDGRTEFEKPPVGRPLLGPAMRWWIRGVVQNVLYINGSKKGGGYLKNIGSYKLVVQKGFYKCGLIVVKSGGCKCCYFYKRGIL